MKAVIAPKDCILHDSIPKLKDVQDSCVILNEATVISTGSLFQAVVAACAIYASYLGSGYCHSLG